MYPKCWSFGSRYVRDAWHTARAIHQIKTNCIANTRMRSVLVLSPQGFLDAVCRCRCRRRLSSTLTSLSSSLPTSWKTHECISLFCANEIARQMANVCLAYLSLCVCIVAVCVCRTFPVCKAVFLDFTTVGLGSYVPAPFRSNGTK